MASQTNAWLETALVTITKLAGTDYEFAALTETVDIDQGDKDIEGIANVAGGRVVKWTPEGDTMITLEIYPTGVNGLESPDGVANLFHGFTSTSTGSNSRTRDLFRVAVLWTNDTTATSGAGATAASTSNKRFVLANAYVTSYKTSFTDGIQKSTVTFKAVPFDKAGTTSNILEEGIDNTASTALTAYTITANFR